DRGQNGYQNVNRRGSPFSTLPQQHGIERECGERGVTAQKARRQKQAKILRRIATKGKVSGEQSHYQRAGDVFKQLMEWKASAEPAGETHIDDVSKDGANSTADE